MFLGSFPFSSLTLHSSMSPSLSSFFLPSIFHSLFPFMLLCLPLISYSMFLGSLPFSSFTNSYPSTFLAPHFYPLLHVPTYICYRISVPHCFLPLPPFSICIPSSFSFPPCYSSHLLLFLSPSPSYILSDVSLRFDQGGYGDTEDHSLNCGDSDELRFLVQRTALSGALSTLVNPIVIRVIPVTLNNFDWKKYSPPPDFPSQPRAESK